MSGLAEQEELDGLRAEIDRIDDSLCELLACRTIVVGLVMRLKRRAGLPPTDDRREQAVLRGALRRYHGAGGLDRSVVVAVFDALFQAARRTYYTTAVQDPNDG